LQHFLVIFKVHIADNALFNGVFEEYLTKRHSPQRSHPVEMPLIAHTGRTARLALQFNFLSVLFVFPPLLLVHVATDVGKNSSNSAGDATNECAQTCVNHFCQQVQNSDKLGLHVSLPLVLSQVSVHFHKVLISQAEVIRDEEADAKYQRPSN